MNIFAWFLIGYIAFGGIGGIALIGKKRTPTTPAAAIAGTIISAVLILLVVLAATR